MKKTILALAAVLALSGSAFAASAPQPVKQTPAATCVDTKTHAKLDCSTTGSIEKTDGSTESKGPRVGIDVNPWIVPGF